MIFGHVLMNNSLDWTLLSSKLAQVPHPWRLTLLVGHPWYFSGGQQWRLQIVPDVSNFLKFIGLILYGCTPGLVYHRNGYRRGVVCDSFLSARFIDLTTLLITVVPSNTGRANLSTIPSISRVRGSLIQRWRVIVDDTVLFLSGTLRISAMSRCLNLSSQVVSKDIDPCKKWTRSSVKNRNSWAYTRDIYYNRHRDLIVLAFE